MKDTKRALATSRVLDDGAGTRHGVPSGQRRVHEALSDKEAVPWESPSPGLRSRILSEVSGTVIRGDRSHRVLWATAACAALAGLSVWVSLQSGAPVMPTPRHSTVGPELGRDLSLLARRSESALLASQTPLLQEARFIQQDTERAARMVLARLPLR